jgi:AcrR family transcriptional regulator
VAAPTRATKRGSKKAAPARATNSGSKKGAPAARKRLSRDRVVEAAVGLADQRGIEALTMRNLSEELGVVPMALYKHVAHKDELLGRMVDAVFSEIDYDREQDWRKLLRARALALRQALLRHPWAVGLMETGALGPSRLTDHETVMRCLRVDVGLTLPMSLHALGLLDGLVYGFTLQQRAYAADLGGKKPTETPKAKNIRQPIPDPEEYPYVTELLGELERQGYDYGEEFEFGLELTLDGIDRLR